MNLRLTLLVHAGEQSGVARVVPDGIEQWVHADQCHVEAAFVDCALERFEGMVEITNTKIINADLVRRAGIGWSGEESVVARAPVGLPSVLLVHAKKIGGVELWLVCLE